MSTHLNKQETDGNLKLKPIVHDWVKTLLGRTQFLFRLLEKYGSPLNIHSLIPFNENRRLFESVFTKYGLDYQIFYARKANKCLQFLEPAKDGRLGVDTASFQELKDGLDMGIPNRNLVVTAAVKPFPLMKLAVDNEVLVILDNWDEVELLQKAAHGIGKTVKVGLRLGGFSFQVGNLRTRFGFPPSDAIKVISQIQEDERVSNIRFEGFHFHLNGYNMDHRIKAIKETLVLVDKLKEKGIDTKFLDIGGGILVNYLESESAWQEFHNEVKDAVLGKRNPINYKNDGLGMENVGGKLIGEPKVYPYFNNFPKEKFIDFILNAAFDEKTKIYEALNLRHIQVRIEPGRSLLDQAGISVARVIFRKRLNGDWFFGLEMNRTQLFSSSADFLLDPLLLPKQEKPSGAISGYLVGAYCLEQELILKRKMSFNTFPQVGDLLCFINTAGYMMHFYESQAHLFDLAKNVFLGANDEIILDRY
ncbi:Y4yA family PLP-dependent enzyme [Cyclobacterium sp.]|uniref:Y4yA family PLP-dependent enzyme n=1 Tax=Cyclobacterium sp. TaxID=1966343 RepID=UPI001986E4C0|nr:Y4yA family PLP-dependent enzyme [Cyclobacterium sp.]MBD3627828.1 Y4yA family PLP-dependent enzyme [Cyclobacterium sp.]